MRFAVPVAFFPNGSNHLPAILPNKIPKSKKNPQVRFLSVAEDLNDCDLGVKDWKNELFWRFVSGYAVANPTYDPTLSLVKIKKYFQEVIIQILPGILISSVAK